MGKHFAHTAMALGMAIIGSAPAWSRTGAAVSNNQTDVQSDATASQYQEERDRADLLRSSKVIFVNGDEGSRADRDSVESMLAQFYYDQFRSSHDPEAPIFTFMSKDANLAMGIGGVGVVSGWFDWNGMVEGGNFNVYNIMMPKTPEAMKNLGAGVSGTKLFFNIMGRHTSIGNFRAYIEAGFSGYNQRDFQLKKAWFQISDFTVGLASSTFSDAAAEPDVMDPAGANGKIGKSNILVRYMKTWRNRWTVAASVEFPNSQPMEIANQTKKVRDYVPDIATFGQLQWDRGFSHVRLAALLRDMSYRDLISQRNRHTVGWGVQLSSVVRAGNFLTLYAMGSVGQGIASYTGDLSNGHNDLLPTPEVSGKLYAPTTVSVTAGAKAQFTSKLSSTVCLSTLRHFPKSGAEGDFYQNGQYLSASLVS
ncbi:MAG: hypothetical protein K2J06_02645, partial [Muribaculaceae bacterium]|nr:hypothetical protein [Muribaculaceae bacterium]